MQYMCHMFITRHWPEDEKEFKKKLFYYNALDLPVQLLLFPEGDLTAHDDHVPDAGELGVVWVCGGDECLHTPQGPNDRDRHGRSSEATR